MEKKIVELIFSIKVNKYKPARVNVYCNQTRVHMGSFGIDIEKPEDFSEWKLLDERQRYEFKLYFYNIKYLVEELKAEPIEFENIRLVLNTPLTNAMHKLAVECGKQNLEFNPVNAMLNGMLNYCRNIEAKLSKENPKFTALPEIGISLTSKQKALKNEKGEYLQLIFRSLSKVYNKHDKLIEVAKLFDKQQTISDNAIKLIAEGKSKASSWMVSTALMVLGKEGDPVISEIPLDDLLELWISPLIRTEKITDENAAIKMFNLYFKKITIKKDNMTKYFN